MEADLRGDVARLLADRDTLIANHQQALKDLETMLLAAFHQQMHDLGDQLEGVRQRVSLFKAEKEKHKAELLKLREECVRELEAIKNTQAPKYERIKQLLLSQRQQLDSQKAECLKLRGELTQKTEESAKRQTDINRLQMELEVERKRVAELAGELKDAKDKRGVAEGELQQEKIVASGVKKEADAKLGEAKKNLLAAQKERDEAVKKENAARRELTEKREEASDAH